MAEEERSIEDRLLFGELTEEERDDLYRQYLEARAVEEAERAERQRIEEETHRKGKVYIELNGEPTTYSEFVRRLNTALEGGHLLRGELSGPGESNEILRFVIRAPHQITMRAQHGEDRFLVTPLELGTAINRLGYPLDVPAMWPRTHNIRFDINDQDAVTLSDVLDEVNHYFEDPLYTHPIADLEPTIHRKAGNQQVRSVMNPINATPGMGPVSLVGEFLGVRPPSKAGMTTHELNRSEGIFAPRAGPLRTDERRSWVNVHPMTLEERMAKEEQARLKRNKATMNSLNGGRRSRKRSTRRKRRV
jgi:hypothetical protein